MLAVRDYQKSLRVSDQGEERLDYPKSNVLYYELEDSNWCCVRPSGTEPKIKLYVATKAGTQEGTDALNEKLTKACQELMK